MKLLCSGKTTDNNMRNTDSKYVLITGGTSGIGYHLAKVFAEKGFNIVLVARTEDALSQTADELNDRYDVDVIPIAKDLFEPESPFELYQDIRSRGIFVHVLVNDAGQGVYGPFADSDLQRQLQIIQLNVSSLTALTYLFLQDMISRNEGKILHLASIVSEIPAPLQAVYGGTKAFVLTFSEALRNELKDTAITVTALQPGATDTDFFNKAGALDSKIVRESTLADPEKVARDGYEALMNNDDKVVSGIKNKIQSAMSNVIPDTILAEKMRKQSEETDQSKKNDNA
jgi:short-subunit dehydrogenase